MVNLWYHFSVNKRVLFLIISLQIIIITAILFRIYQKRTQVLGVADINLIKKEEINMGPSGDLKYFYEPKANVFRLDDKIGPGKGNKINSDSLNERFEYSPEKPDGVFRIITLGDSITYGLHVETKDNWTEVLEDKLNQEMKCANIKKFEIINLGVPGYDNPYSVERYITRGRKYNPDLVIWYQFDLLRLDESILENEPEELINLQKTLPNQDIEKLKQMAWQLAARKTLNEYGEEKLLKISQDAIKSLNNYYSGKLILVSFPEMREARKNVLRQLVEQDKNISLLDNTRDYLKEGGAVDDVHPNPKGHIMVAEDIFNYLEANNFINCK